MAEMTEEELKELAGDIGQNVRDKRQKKEESLEVFSKNAGVSKEALFKLEKGRHLPNTKLLAKISHYLKINVKRLFP